MYVCVYACVCVREYVYRAVLESKSRGNINFCIKTAQTTSCNGGNQYIYQVTDGRAWR